MKLSQYFCPWCEGARLEFREVSEGAPNGAGSAQLRGIKLSCSLAQVTGCPDATGACGSEVEAEWYAAQQCKTHALPSEHVQGRYADYFARWAAGADPALVQKLTSEAPPRPIYVFALNGLSPSECSYAAVDGDAARELLHLDLASVPGSMDGLVSVELVAELMPESRGPEVEALGYVELCNLLKSWEADPTTDLHNDKVYPQHDDFLSAHQAGVEARWKWEREAHDKRQRAALQERADRAGVPVQVMALIEDQAAHIARLERALRALVKDSNGDNVDAGACWRVLEGRA